MVQGDGWSRIDGARQCLDLKAALGLMALLACSDTVEPKPEVDALVTQFAIVVTDSLDQGLGGAYAAGYGWVGTTRVQLERESPFRADATGRSTFHWPKAQPSRYDSITFVVPERLCYPYAAGHLTLAAESLRNLPGDSVEARLPVGLAVAPPVLEPGAKACGGAEKDFGAYELWLAIDTWPTVAGDSLRAQWDIHFRETSVLQVDDAAGVIRSDSLVLNLRIDAPSRCAPGYLLRAQLEEGRLGEASLEAQDLSDPACALLVKAIHPLRMVPFPIEFWDSWP